MELLCEARKKFERWIEASVQVSVQENLIRFNSTNLDELDSAKIKTGIFGGKIIYNQT